MNSIGENYEDYISDNSGCELFKKKLISNPCSVLSSKYW